MMNYKEFKDKYKSNPTEAIQFQKKQNLINLAFAAMIQLETLVEKLDNTTNEGELKTQMYICETNFNSLKTEFKKVYPDVSSSWNDR